MNNMKFAKFLTRIDRFSCGVTAFQTAWFDIIIMQEEDNLIDFFVRRVRSKTDYRMHTQSAFNQIFDWRLTNLVLIYAFNFEAIALHLSYQFPQFDYKITRRSVAYRWYQLKVTPREEPQQPQERSDKREMPSEIKKEYAKQIIDYDIEDSGRLEEALLKAQQLDDEEQTGFIMYKPRFVPDSEYMLQREGFQNEKVEQILNNSFSFDFGLFEKAAGGAQEKKAESTRSTMEEEACFDVEGYDSD